MNVDANILLSITSYSNAFYRNIHGVTCAVFKKHAQSHLHEFHIAFFAKKSALEAVFLPKTNY